MEQADGRVEGGSAQSVSALPAEKSKYSDREHSGRIKTAATSLLGSAEGIHPFALTMPDKFQFRH
jgi:hypothetical protein